MALFDNLAAVSDGDCGINFISLKMKDSIITELKL